MLYSEYNSARIDKCVDSGSSCRFIVDINCEIVTLKGEKLKSLVYGTRNCWGVKACDCIIFTRDGYLLIVELEKTVENFEKYAKSQLVNCARMVEYILEEHTMCIDDSKVYFILVCKYWKDRLLRPSRDRERFNIRFRGRNRNIILRCGKHKVYLSEILSKL